MADEQLVSFNPDEAEASGLIDNVRATITKVAVDIFTANSGTKFVNVDVTYKSADAPEPFTEHYLLGGADQWAPNAAKTGAINLREGGGKVWNKSDVFKLTKSIVDSGLPKARLGGDLSVLVGLDVHVKRVTNEGATYTDKKGVVRPRTTMLVTKIYTEAAQLTSGAYAAAGKPAAAGKAAAPKAAKAGAAAASGDDSVNDEFATEVLGKGPLAKDGLKSPAFLVITKKKQSAIREAVQARLINDAFLGSLVEAGLIAYDGTTVSLA